MKRKAIIYFITVTFIIVTMVFSLPDMNINVSANTLPTFSMKVNKSSIVTGEEITVTLWGKNLSDMYAFEFHISYTTDNLIFVKGKPQDGNYSLGALLKKEGKIICSIYKSSKASVNDGNIPIYSLVFRGNSAGNANIKIDFVKVLETKILAETSSTLFDNSISIRINVPTEETSPSSSSPPAKETEEQEPEQDGNETETVESDLEKGLIRIDAETDNSGIANIELVTDELEAAMDTNETGIVIIGIQGTEKAKAINVSVDAWLISMAKEKNVEKIKVDVGPATITIAPDKFSKYLVSGSEKIELSVSIVDISTLPEEIKNIVGNNTVYDFNISIDGQKISDFNGQEVIIGIKYELKPGEDPSKIVIYHINEDGNLEIIRNGRYNSETGEVEFKVKHLSKYTAMYRHITFSDLNKAEWAREFIEALAARDVINGMPDGSYRPNDKITRCEFAKILIKALDLEDPEAECPFIDVDKNSWYYSSVASAYKLGIVKGIGGGKFAPDAEILRQDMAVMAYRAAKAAGIDLTPVRDAKVFIDSDRISDYALDSVKVINRAGIIDGNEYGYFRPFDSSTRAEAAKIVYLLYLFSK